MTTKEQGLAKVGRLVDAYRSRLRELRSNATSEAVIRQEFLDPFWEALGWDVRNRANKAAGEKDVLIEAGVDTIEDKRFRHKRCDYFFRVSGFPRFLLEAKKPAVEADDPDAVFQTKTYAWNAKIPFAILSNFEEFRLFDSTVTPSRAHPTRGIVQDFKLGFEDYVSQWDALWATFSREAVEAGSLDILFARIKKLRAGRRVRSADRMLFDIRGTALVDQVFLKHLEDYRERIAKVLYRDNRGAFPDAETRHGAANLTEAAQRLLDRLVFIRVCEDREIMPYGRLLKLLEDCKSEEVYGRLVEVFRELDAKYNGYLFKPHPLSEGLDVDGTTLSEFIRSLYTPVSPYCFDRIGDDILGIIYERFLGSVITVDHGRVSAEQKPEVRHAGGVYYTPRFVVDSIIRRVIGPKIEGKSPKEVLKVKVLDPACGSGSFLIAAFQYLMDHCAGYFAEHPTEALEHSGRGNRRVTIQHAWKGTDGGWHLSTEFRAKLLTSCIHGIDIDQQAVEVTVMSLYIKMLEAAIPQQQFLSERMLPSLDNNIRCGNSLIDPEELQDHLDENEGPLFASFDEDTQFRINPFAWQSDTRGFGRVFREAQGFDCIIGNPPYIEIQELNKWAPQECQFYKRRFKAASRGNFDIYVAFLERGLELLAPQGLLGFICPHLFWTAKYGEAIRDLIAAGKHLRAIIDFGHQQVFEGATTYTAIHVAGKAGNRGSVDFARFLMLGDGKAQCTALDDGKTPEGTERFKAPVPAAGATWTFHDPEADRWRQSLAGDNPTLASIADELFVGLQTSADTVFLFKNTVIGNEQTTVQSAELGEALKIESALLRPVVRSGEVGRYWATPSALVLFPYRVERGRAVLIPEREMRRDFPRAWDYLKRNESLLRGRERGKFDHAEWYGLMRKNLEKWEGPKVMVPYMVTDLSAYLDEVGDLYFVNVTTGGFGIRTSKLDPLLLVAYLNSSVLDRWFKTQARPFRGDYYGANKQYIENLPIKLPRTPAEKHTADRIAAAARAITEAHKRLRAGNIGDHQRTRLEREIETQEAQVNRLVNQLYGVDPEA